jgi:hypothetical protein
MHADRFSGLICRFVRENEGKVARYTRNSDMTVYFTYLESSPYGQLTQAIVGTFDDLIDMIKCAKFNIDRSRGFCSAGA